LASSAGYEGKTGDLGSKSIPFQSGASRSASSGKETRGKVSVIDPITLETLSGSASFGAHPVMQPTYKASNNRNTTRRLAFTLKAMRGKGIFSNLKIENMKN
jgi:hypothetical protein